MKKINTNRAITPELKNPLSPPDGYESVAVFYGDEVGVIYENKDTGDMIDVDWPFTTDFVFPDDCERLGIRVFLAD